MYVTPERLQNREFLRLIQSVGCSLLAIDVHSYLRDAGVPAGLYTVSSTPRCATRLRTISWVGGSQ